MEYPDFPEAVMDRLMELGFEGLDANPFTSLFEYGGLYSPDQQVALLCMPDERDPHIAFRVITKQEIGMEIVRAGSGFQGFTDGTLPHFTHRYMDAIQSMMLWNGGWHESNRTWRTLSECPEGELLANLNYICNKEKQNA